MALLLSLTLVILWHPYPVPPSLPFSHWERAGMREAQSLDHALPPSPSPLGRRKPASALKLESKPLKLEAEGGSA
jgi:hypothetical protein